MNRFGAGFLTLTLLGAAAAPLVPGSDATRSAGAITNSVGMTLKYLEAGEFLMGEGDAPPRSREEWLHHDSDEAPAHQVLISRPFYLSVHEVTNAQYERFDLNHKKLRGEHGATKEDDEPVTFVTWQQAMDFCGWLSKQEGKPYRLPTEAEWEYACRAGTTTLFSTGERLLPEQANLGLTPDGKPRPAAMNVGSYKPNPWGLFDLHGNVAEWCLDWHGPYEAGKQTDPVGRADGHARVVRGWSYLQPGNQGAARFARSANRSGLLPEDANRYAGFRVVQAEMPSSKPLPVAAVPLHQKDVKQTASPRSGPDRDKPYFVDYAIGQKNPTIAPNSWGPIFSNHNHYSAACVCPNGDVLAVWYTCVGERDRQLAQAASRLRAGSDQWEPASLFFGVPDVNCHAPVLLRDGGRIYHFCTQSLHGWDHASNIMRYSDDSGATWSKPQIILPRTAPDHLSQPCSAFVAADGTLVLACDGDLHKDERLMLSADRGQTWKVAKGDMRQALGKSAIHPAVVARKDGAILSFLRGPDPMPLLVSEDNGDTWEVTQSPFPGISGGQKAAVLRLASGAILLLTIDRNRQLGGGAVVALSLDEGKTWPHARKVDAPVGGYLSLAQAPNGTIYLIGSRMNFAACNETWIREGKPWPVKGDEPPAR
jgi:formylglycine-generating enzyme required for sulfatase activity